jgi:predicted phosphate transport protein (TIGR00153 family)
MILKKIFPKENKEQVVIEEMRSLMELLVSAFEAFRKGLDTRDRNLLRRVIDHERQGDSIRREIIARIYEGAFLPYIRPNLCKFVEILDDIFGVLKETAFYLIEVSIPEKVSNDCARIATLNVRACEMLLMTYDAMLEGEDLREKTLAVRIYEKKVDDIKFGLMKDLRAIPVKGFWEGKMLSDLVSGLADVSNVIEDASDYLQIISTSMR